MPDIEGYRELSKIEIDAINRIKAAEITLGSLWKVFKNHPDVDCDGRWMSVAKTHFEEGFTAFVRSIAKPEERF